MYMHLTNYSVNKKSQNYVDGEVEDEDSTKRLFSKVS